MSDELRLNSFLIEIGFSVCLGLAATQILHHIKLDKTKLFLDTQCGGGGGGGCRGETDRVD